MPSLEPRSSVPDLRIRPVRQAPVNGDGSSVLYWMSAARRLSHNFALDRAVDWSRSLGLPLRIVETLPEWRWSTERRDDFIRDGMREHAATLAKRGIAYRAVGDPNAGAVRELARASAVVITDDAPWLPPAPDFRGTRVEAVDSNGLLPMRAAEKVHPTAHSFRRFLQKELQNHLTQRPRTRPLVGSVLESTHLDWPRLPEVELGGEPGSGGTRTARLTWRAFDVDLYPENRRSASEPTSGLSPYLHHGHIGSHEIFWDLVSRFGWEAGDGGPGHAGHREGWWHLEPAVEAFLDQLVTWREVGINMAWQRDDFDRYESLPDWARRTLREHAKDRRDPCYDLDQFDAAGTHCELWNAAQRQLVREGLIHNALRMLWGKKILHWSRSPREALSIMIELNNRYALDGCDPNSYSGIFWVLGRYDRAWGPERPIFGKIRYMSSENTGRKLRVKPYLEKYAS